MFFDLKLTFLITKPVMWGTLFISINYLADNVFSSLAGLRFVWKLMPQSADSDPLSHHLVHVPLKETPLTDCGGFCGDLDTQIRVEDSVYLSFIPLSNFF